MSLPSAESINPRSTQARNLIRAERGKLNSVVASTGNSLENRVAPLSAARFTTTKNIVPQFYSNHFSSDQSLLHPLYYDITGTSLLRQSYTGALVLYTASADLIVGTHRTVYNQYYILRPINYLTNKYIFRFSYNSTAGAVPDTFTIYLSDGTHDVEIFSVASPTTTETSFTSDPIDISSLTSATPLQLKYRLQKAAGLSSITTKYETLVDAGTDGEIDTVGPAPSGNLGALEYFDHDYVYIAPTTYQPKRLNASLPTTTKLLYDAGSGLAKDGSTVGMTLASGKKITVGSQDIIDASENFAVASGKTVKVGTDTIHDGTRGVYSKTRQIWCMAAQSASGATEPEFTTTSGSYVLFGACAAYKRADELTITLIAECKVSSLSTGHIEVGFTNSTGSFVEESADITSTSYTTVTASIDITTSTDPDANGTELVPIYVYFKNDGGTGTTYVKWAVVEITSKDSY